MTGGMHTLMSMWMDDVTTAIEAEQSILDSSSGVCVPLLSIPHPEPNHTHAFGAIRLHPPLPPPSSLPRGNRF